MAAARPRGTGAIPATPRIANLVDLAVASDACRDRPTVDRLDNETPLDEIAPALGLGVLAGHQGTGPHSVRPLWSWTQTTAPSRAIAALPAAVASPWTSTHGSAEPGKRTTLTRPPLRRSQGVSSAPPRRRPSPGRTPRRSAVRLATGPLTHSPEPAEPAERRRSAGVFRVPAR